MVTCPQSSYPLDPVLFPASQKVQCVFLSTFLVADLERISGRMRYAVQDETVVTTSSNTTTTTTATTGTRCTTTRQLCRLHHLNRTDIHTPPFFAALLKRNVRHKSPKRPHYTAMYIRNKIMPIHMSRRTIMQNMYRSEDPHPNAYITGWADIDIDIKRR
jgi:hypothetical protein